MSQSANLRTGEDFPRLAVLTGCDTIEKIERDQTRKISVEGNNDMTQFVEVSGCKWLRFHIVPGYFRQPLRYNMKNRHLLCNVVSDPDFNPRVLKVIERIATEARLPILNMPKNVWRTARDRCAALLADIPGLTAPKVMRLVNPNLRRLQGQMEKTGFRFPALVREPGLHNGEFVGLFERPEDLQGVFADKPKEFLLTEFVDFASKDGLYRKYRFFFIGDRIILRHLIASESWNVHARDRQGLMMQRAELREEEERALSEQMDAFPARTADILRAIKARIGLDYFGIDCNVTPEGDVLVFEANATMNYLPYNSEPEYLYIGEKLADLTTAAIKRLIEEKVGKPLQQSPELEKIPSATSTAGFQASEPQNA